MKSCALANCCLKNRSLSCDHTPERITDSELAQSSGIDSLLREAITLPLCRLQCLLWTNFDLVPCSLCLELEMAWPHPAGKCLHAYHSQRKCGFTPAAKAGLLWSPYLPLAGSWTPAGLSSPSLMAPSKVHSPQGLAWLEWDTQPVAAAGKGLHDVGARGVKHSLQTLCLKKLLI